MALTFFTRRPEPVPDVEPFVPDRTLWPEIGETWTPEGVTVAERYANLAGAVILVYTTGTTEYDTYYAVACLGCHYATREEKVYSTYSRYSLTAAAKAANAHAMTCRALPRDIPARPDCTAAQKLVHEWVLAARRRSEGEDVPLRITDLDLVRLTLQRPTTWIKDTLEQMAAERPDLVRIERSTYGNTDFVGYYARRPEA